MINHNALMEALERLIAQFEDEVMSQEQIVILEKARVALKLTKGEK